MAEQKHDDEIKAQTRDAGETNVEEKRDLEIVQIKKDEEIALLREEIISLRETGSTITDSAAMRGQVQLAAEDLAELRQCISDLNISKAEDSSEAKDTITEVDNGGDEEISSVLRQLVKEMKERVKDILDDQRRRDKEMEDTKRVAQDQVKRLNEEKKALLVKARTLLQEYKKEKEKTGELKQLVRLR